MIKKASFLSLILLRSFAFTAEDSEENRQTISCAPNWVRSIFNVSSQSAVEAAECTTALSFKASGVSKVVEKVAIPLNQQDAGYVPIGWGYGSEMIEIETLDGVKVTGNWSYSVSSHSSNRVAIMFHGNGMNADHYRQWARWFNRLGLNVLALTIQGYPGSEGSSENLPVASALLVEAAFRFALDVKQIPLDQIVVYGFSLGGAYATYAGRYFNVPVILQNTLTSIGDMPQNIVGKYFPAILGRALARSNFDYQNPMPKFDNLGVFAEYGEVPLNSFNNIENLRETISPVMIIYGENDNLMGGEQRARQLYQARYGEGKTIDPDIFVQIPAGGHCDAFLRNENAEAKVEHFLSSLVK